MIHLQRKMQCVLWLAKFESVTCVWHEICNTIIWYFSKMVLLHIMPTLFRMFLIKDFHNTGLGGRDGSNGFQNHQEWHLWTLFKGICEVNHSQCPYCISLLMFSVCVWVSVWEREKNIPKICLLILKDTVPPISIQRWIVISSVDEHSIYFFHFVINIPETWLFLFNHIGYLTICPNLKLRT